MVKNVKANSSQNDKEEFAATLDFLGLADERFFDKKDSNLDENYIQSQVDLRLKMKAEKNFIKADEIRKELLAQGILLEDVSKEKTIWKV
jgi:cysteinyl-tRNA synthetase